MILHFLSILCFYFNSNRSCAKYCFAKWRNYENYSSTMGTLPHFISRCKDTKKFYFLCFVPDFLLSLPKI